MTDTEKLAILVKDTCETDEYIRKRALEIYDKATVYGDTWGVPPIEDLVDKMVSEIVALRKYKKERENDGRIN